MSNSQITEYCSLAAAVGDPDAQPDSEPAPLRAIDVAACMTGDPEPIPWVVPDWLVEQDVAILAGEPKTGKSWLALTLALAIARGRAWLNLEDPTQPRRVLYVDEENNPRLIHCRIRKLAGGLGLTAAGLAELPLRYLVQNALNLDREDRLQAFWRDVRKFKPELVILDSLVRFHGRDENSNTALAGFFAQVVKPLQTHFRTSVLILHHMAKPSKERPGDLVHRIRGAGDIVAAADQVWTLERRGEEGAILRHERSRWAESPPDLLVRIEDTEDGEGVRVTSAEADDGVEDIIRDTLDDAASEGVPRKGLVGAVTEAGFTERVATKHLGRLAKSGRLHKAREGRAVRYWLAEYAPDDAGRERTTQERKRER